MKRAFSFIFIASLISFVLAFYFFLEGEKAMDFGIPFQVSALCHVEKKPEFLNDFSIIKERLSSNSLDWIELNLPAMKIILHKADGQETSFPLLKRGNPLRWGGTAAGLNKVNFKRLEVLSNTALAFMPFAINFYGKYYIHGEPYYPDGKKLISENSGGCIQVSDSMISAVYDFAATNTPVLVIDKENDGLGYRGLKKSRFPKISAQSYLVADLGSGFVFAKKDEEEQLPIGSLAKLMLAVVLSENTDLESSILVRPRMIVENDSSAPLEVGKRFSLVSLLYPLLIESSDDAAEVLLSYLDKKNTIALMNEKTRMIMMEKTYFADAKNFELENVSSAKDLFYLSRYILVNQPLIFNISRGEPVVPFQKLPFTGLKNKNLFFADSSFVGGKTSSVLASGSSGIFVFKFALADGSRRNVAIILLGTNNLEEGEGNLEEQVLEITNWLKENYYNQ
jgi:D-alanyl-D-alanine carboxypeptidase